MIRQTEREYPNLPEVHDEQNISLDNQNHLTNNKLPDGVAPETYGLLLLARDHKEILDKVDSLDKGKRIINTTRNLLYVYYFNDVSLRGLSKHLGGHSTTNGKRMLEALEAIWQHLPPDLQLQYPKQKTVNLKEDPSKSPRALKKRSEAAITLWQDKEYRQKTLQGIRKRKYDPQFIEKMKKASQGKPSPMEGKNHTQETTKKIGKAAQEIWNRRHNMEEGADPLTKRVALFREWMGMTQLLEHSPSSKEVGKLRKENKTQFSTTMYKREFGGGSFTRARKILTCISSIQEFATVLLNNPSKALKRSILEKDVKTTYQTIMAELESIFSASSIEEIEEKTQLLNGKIPEIKRELDAKMPRFGLIIGSDEKSMWSYAVEQNLLSKILQGNMLTQQEIDLLRRYFENGIIGKELSVGIIDRFTVAVAKIS